MVHVSYPNAMSRLALLAVLSLGVVQSALATPPKWDLSTIHIDESAPSLTFDATTNGNVYSVEFTPDSNGNPTLTISHGGQTVAYLTSTSDPLVILGDVEGQSIVLNGSGLNNVVPPISYDLQEVVGVLATGMTIETREAPNPYSADWGRYVRGVYPTATEHFTDFSSTFDFLNPDHWGSDDVPNSGLPGAIDRGDVPLDECESVSKRTAVCEYDKDISVACACGPAECEVAEVILSASHGPVQNSENCACRCLWDDPVEAP